MSKEQVQCNKRSYWTKGEAVQHVASIMATSTGKIPTRAYRCGRCPFYHLTSQDLYDTYKRDAMMQKLHEFEKAVRTLSRVKSARSMLSEAVDLEPLIKDATANTERLRTGLAAFIAEALPEDAAP